MTAAILYRRRPDDAQREAVARVSADGRSARVLVEPLGGRGAEAILELLGEGIPGPDDEVLTLDDGDAFVEALPEAFRGTRLWAELVEYVAPPPVR